MTVTRTRRTLDGKGVAAVMQAAEQAAERSGYRVVIAVVDAAGTLRELRSTEGAQAASAQVAIDKARTAAIFVRPSREIEEQVSGGRLGALALHGAAALTGGIPLTVDSEVVGAIGTSGETPDEDESVSKAGAAAAFTTTTVPALTYAGAKLAAEASAREAERRGVSPVVAVVDAAGELVYLWRPDGAQVASVAVATDKARTAALYRRPSKDFEDQASGGRPSALQLARAVPLQGGMPITYEGAVVGAIGVSGASSAGEDQELSVLGAHAAEEAAAGAGTTTYLSSADVDAKFAEGGLLVDTARYKLDAGRRTGAGEVELHDTVTDIMRVVEGEATVVTGGNGDATTHQLRAGDILVIPEGVPHQFTAVSDPFLYFVVKVES
jgi:glc operon protein GlcG